MMMHIITGTTAEPAEGADSASMGKGHGRSKSNIKSFLLWFNMLNQAQIKSYLGILAKL